MNETDLGKIIAGALEKMGSRKAAEVRGHLTLAALAVCQHLGVDDKRAVMRLLAQASGLEESDSE